MKKLFLDWAEVDAEAGKTPACSDYEMHGKIYDQGAGEELRRLDARTRDCWGMPERHNWKDDWQDVMEIAEAALRVAQAPARTLVKRNLSLEDESQPTSVYGPPMMTASPLVYAPTNEAGE